MGGTGDGSGRLYVIMVILLKTGQNCDIEGKNWRFDFFKILLGNESLTSLVYIKHKLTGWQELVGYATPCYKRHQKCMNRLSCQFDSCQFFYHTIFRICHLFYFLINYLLLFYFISLLSCLLNDFAGKCLLQSTDSFLLLSNLRGWGVGGDVLH